MFLEGIMFFYFHNLDEKTQNTMLKEVAYDMERKALYVSSKLNTRVRAKYPRLLMKSIENANPVELAEQLEAGYLYTPRQLRQRQEHGTPEIGLEGEALAYSEFNRFYIRAICRRALMENAQVRIYCAKTTGTEARQTTIQRAIGKAVSPFAVLVDLRAHIGKNCLLGVIGGINLGLSVELVAQQAEA